MALVEKKGHDYEKSFTRAAIQELVARVRKMDEEEFDLFVKELGFDGETTETPVDETPTDDTKDETTQTEVAETIDDVEDGKSGEVGESEQAALETEIATDENASDDIQENTDDTTPADTGDTPEQGEPDNVKTDDVQDEVQATTDEVNALEQGIQEDVAKAEEAHQAEGEVHAVEGETIKALLSRIDTLEEKLSLLAEQKAELPAYGGMSRHGTLADGDIGGTQDGKPRTIEEFRRRFAHLNKG